MSTVNSFGAKSTLTVGSTDYEIFRIDTVPGYEKLPFSLKVLLENLLRTEDGANVTKAQIQALGSWEPTAEPDTEIQFTPARVVMQDFTGVPCIVDLATMREAVERPRRRPEEDQPARAGRAGHRPLGHRRPVRHRERARAQRRDRVRAQRRALPVPALGPDGVRRLQGRPAGNRHRAPGQHRAPGEGHLHRVTVERRPPRLPRHLRRHRLAHHDGQRPRRARLGRRRHRGRGGHARPARVDAHPAVVGFKLTGSIPTGVTATDVVLTITDMLRKHGVVGKFVEFYGDGVASVPLANRATIGNMSPEFGSTAAMFPIDEVTLDYLRLTGRSEEQVALVEAYSKPQKLWHDPSDRARVQRVPRARPRDRRAVDRRPEAPAGPHRADRREDPVRERPQRLRRRHDLSKVDAASRAPSRPSDPPGSPRRTRRPRTSTRTATSATRPTNGSKPTKVSLDGRRAFTLDHGAVTIAAITSCTNTSNPSVMLAAGLLARNAAKKGLKAKPWVKTTLAPGSKVVTDYYEKAGLTDDLEALGFYTVGYGCTTCIGNSGPLIEEVSAAINENDLAVTAVLSGNRNFEGRINPDVKMNYLASPPLVIAYALAGSMNFDFETDPLGKDQDGNDVFLKDIWPDAAEVQATIDSSIYTDMFTHQYASVFEGDERWKTLPTPTGATLRVGRRTRPTCASPRTSTA